MKRIFSLMMVVLFASFLFTSCGGSKDKDKKDTEKKEVTADDNESEDAEEMEKEDTEVSSAAGCGKVVNDYEEFCEDYIVIVEKSKKNPTDLSILSELSTMMKDYQEWSTKIEDCAKDPEYAQKFVEISDRITKAAESIK